MDIILAPLFKVLMLLISLGRYMLIAYALLSWLIMFGVLQNGVGLMGRFYNALTRLIEPILEPVRQRLPTVGGFDLAFMVVFFGLYFIEGVFERLLLRFL